MIDTPRARKPQLFSADDPLLVEESPHADTLAGDSPTSPTPGTDDQTFARPTLAELGARGWRWGMVLVSALSGAAALGIAAWFSRLVAAALSRDDWLGWLTLALLLIAAFATLMLILRELIGFTRLSRLNRLRAHVDAALRMADRQRERRAAARIARLYAARADVSWGLRRFREHARDVRDPGELLTLAEREIMVPLDAEARRVVTQSAKRVATVTALSPLVLIAVGYVLIECLRMLRALATLYGGRPGFVGAMRLAQMVVAHLVATGGVALTDDLLGQFLGQDVLRRLSRRLGEGAFNGALTARVGVAAIDVIRPIPYLGTRRLRIRDVVGEALRPLFARKGPPS